MSPASVTAMMDRAGGPSQTPRQKRMIIGAFPLSRKRKNRRRQRGIRDWRGRPKLAVSSTSWTPNKDFGILIDSLVKLDDLAADSLQGTSKGVTLTAPMFHAVMVIIIGKGPQKAAYKKCISGLNLSCIAVITLWLKPADYLLLLGSADLRVSLHTSTSRLDLPMKVLNMFGCEVPVCAANF